MKVLDGTADALELEVIPFTARQSLIAREAFGVFGKGRHSKARLNVGDCMAYATAKSLGAPLLFKGSDFAQTDVTPA